MRYFLFCFNLLGLFCLFHLKGTGNIPTGIVFQSMAVLTAALDMAAWIVVRREISLANSLALGRMQSGSLSGGIWDCFWWRGFCDWVRTHCGIMAVGLICDLLA